MKRQQLSHLIIGTIIVCIYSISYSCLLDKRSHISEAEQSHLGIWNVPPAVLLALTGEFKGLVADYLTLEAGSRLGTEVVRNPEGGFRTIKRNYDWPTIHKIFVASQILDPSFAQTYMVAQGWLPWKPAEMVAETQEILKIAAKNRPWDWHPMHLIGFNTYYFLKQPGNAGILYLEAAKIADSPSWLAIIGARLAQKSGDAKTAVAIMKSMLSEKDPNEPGYKDMVDRLKALEGVVLIEEAISRYEEKQGYKPSFISELIASGILEIPPSNPYEVEYCIDQNGMVYFDKPDCRINASGDRL